MRHGERLQGRLARRVDDVAAASSPQQQMAVRHLYTGPARLTAICCPMSRSLSNSTRHGRYTAALLNRMSTLPKRLSISAKVRVTLDGFPTSVTYGMAQGPRVLRRLLEAFVNPGQQQGRGTLLDESTGDPETRSPLWRRPRPPPQFAPQLQARFLISVKSSNPWRPHSRPSPDCL